MTDSIEETAASRETPPRSNALVLASRWARLGGALYDSVVVMFVLVPLALLTGYWARARAGDLTLFVAVLWGGGAWVIFLLLNGRLLATRGQTIGKLVANTRIVAADPGEIVALWREVFFRYFLVGVLSLLPIIGSYVNLLDLVFIFRRDKRCIHDLVAGTKVVAVREDPPEQQL
jgi:uncharacterized RDD family membrane protein YckC